MCIPPNPRRVGYIVPIHGALDGPLYMGSHIHQQNELLFCINTIYSSGLMHFFQYLT